MQIGETPLHMASEFGHIEVCKVLLRAGAGRDRCNQVGPQYSEDLKKLCDFVLVKLYRVPSACELCYSQEDALELVVALKLTIRTANWISGSL